MKTLIIGDAVLYEFDGACYMSATNVKSLAQWVEALPDPVLALPFKSSTEVPVGMVPAPEEWSFHKLASTEGLFAVRRNESVRSLKYLMDDQPALVYCRMPSYCAYWAFKLATSRGIPILTELHGDWSEAFRALATKNLAFQAIRRGQAVWARKAYGTMGRYSAAVSCIGPKLKEMYVAPSVMSIVTTNHTVPEAMYFRRDTYAANTMPILLFVGELERRKGLHILFDSLRMLSENDTPFLLRLIGHGSEKERLAAYAEKYGFSSNVEFCGFMSNNNELFDQYRKADAFVLPSIAAEGVPRVIHEAMAMSCPVVATDIGSTAWQLRNNGGIVVKPGDATSLKLAIEKVIASPEVQRELSASGFETAKCHTYEKQKQQIADFVCEVLANIETKRRRP